MNARITLVCKCGITFNTYSQSGFTLCPTCRKINNKKFKNIAPFDENYFLSDETFSSNDFDVLKDKFLVNSHTKRIDNIVRKACIQIRVSEKERTDLHSFANLMNMDLSTLIRSVLLTQYYDILKDRGIK